MIELKPGDYTEMPSDPITRKQIIWAFIEAGANYAFEDIHPEFDFIGWDARDGKVYTLDSSMISVSHCAFNGHCYSVDSILSDGVWKAKTPYYVGESDKPDYRDGQWHLHDGSEDCPVNPNDLCDFLAIIPNYPEEPIVSMDSVEYKIPAKDLGWTNIVAFRVVDKTQGEREQLVNCIQNYLHNIGLTGFRYSKQQMDIFNALYDAGFLKEPEV